MASVIVQAANCYTCAFLLLAVAILQTTTAAINPQIQDSLRFKRNYDASRNQDSDNAVKTVEVDPAIKGGTVFATENSTVVVAQTGGTARLPCIVRKSNSGTVSWIRKDKQSTILTIGINAHIADERFLVEHARHLQNWGLVIKHVRHSDAGLYECQVSTYPTTSIFIELRVTEASAEIMGAPDLHVRAGSSLRLVCTIQQATEPPVYVFWYHDQKMINHEPGVSVATEATTSVLQLKDADPSHSGNYTCHPSNAVPAYINVHVLNATEEENPAAMLHASSSGISTTLFMSVILIVTINITLSFNS